MDLMDLVQSNLSEGLIEQLSSKIGGDPKQTAVATTGIMSTLMGALAKNASTPEGANSIAKALDNDHDGGILDNLSDIFSGNAANQNERALNGNGILNHLLGDRQSGAVDMISKMSGLGSNQAGSLMSMLAPVIMGSLGKAKRQGGLDVSGIASLLTNSVNAQHQNDANPAMGLISRFLDQDNDGSIMDDVASMGMKMLGGFFGRK